MAQISQGIRPAITRPAGPVQRQAAPTNKSEIIDQLRDTVRQLRIALRPVQEARQYQYLMNMVESGQVSDIREAWKRMETWRQRWDEETERMVMVGYEEEH